MAEPLAAASALEGLTVPPLVEMPGMTLREIHGLATTALHGPEDMLPGLPAAPGWTSVAGGIAIWTAPGQWLLLHAPDNAPALPPSRHTHLTGARCILEVAGPRAADALATLLPLDLHPRAFPPGAAAATIAAHIPVLVWREVECFRIACFRSFGMALADSLIVAGRGRALAVL